MFAFIAVIVKRETRLISVQQSVISCQQKPGLVKIGGNKARKVQGSKFKVWGKGSSAGCAPHTNMAGAEACPTNFS
jgi:hypothetical protein